VHGLAVLSAVGALVLACWRSGSVLGPETSISVPSKNGTNPLVHHDLTPRSALTHLASRGTTTVSFGKPRGPSGRLNAEHRQSIGSVKCRASIRSRESTH
jgi:hypothetical protein